MAASSTDGPKTTPFNCSAVKPAASNSFGEKPALAKDCASKPAFFSASKLQPLKSRIRLAVTPLAKSPFNFSGSHPAARIASSPIVCPPICSAALTSAALNPALSKSLSVKPPCFSALALHPAYFLTMAALTPANRCLLIASALHPAFLTSSGVKPNGNMAWAAFI